MRASTPETYASVPPGPAKGSPMPESRPESTPESALLPDRPEGEPRAGLLALARAHALARHAAESATLRPTKAVRVVADAVNERLYVSGPR